MIEIFKNCFLLIDDNTGPVSCEDKGLNMQSLPDNTRKPTQVTHTFSCNVVSDLQPEQYFWYKNGMVSYISIIKENRNHR